MTTTQRELVTRTCARYPEICSYDDIPHMVLIALHHIHDVRASEVNSVIHEIRVTEYEADTEE